MKTIEQSFIDWEAYVFGFGYGTGEDHTIAALKAFFENVGRDDMPNSYDYQRLETALGPQITWLLINTLCHADILEYGTSPRYAWLTEEGVRLREFVASKSVEDLVNLCAERSDDTAICYPDGCNCGPNGYEEGRRCPNPFWRSR